MLTIISVTLISIFNIMNESTLSKVWWWAIDRVMGERSEPHTGVFNRDFT